MAQNACRTGNLQQGEVTWTTPLTLFCYLLELIINIRVCH